MNLSIQSQFRPFTFDELVKPLLIYKQAYQETEKDYSDLLAQTEIFKDIATRENSKEAYELYSNFSNELGEAVDDFSKGNINRRALLGLRRRYFQDIVPIAKANEAMNAANEFRQKLGPDAIFEVSGYNSIDDFLHGKTANNKYESRKDISARTAALFQTAAQSILQDPIIRNSMSPQFLEVIQKQGLGSLEELQAAIAGNSAAANRFSELRDQIISQIGGLDRFDAIGRAAVEGAINEGAYAGLNNYKISLQKNDEYMTKAQRISAAHSADQLELQRQKLENKQNNKTPKLGSILGVTNLRMTDDSKYVLADKGSINKVYSKDSLEGAIALSDSDTTRAEDLYIEQFLKDYPGLKRENLRFYRQWVDKDGDVCSPNEEGAKKVLLVTDK